MNLQSEIEEQKEKLKKLEKEYDQWEIDLENAELELFQYQDMIESLNYGDKNIDQLIQSLERNYEILEGEVKELENKYPDSNNKTSLSEAKKIFNILQKLNTEIDRCKESPFIKTINIGFGQMPTETQS